MNIPNKARRIMNVLRSEGAIDALIVGGFVRDSLIGLGSKDVDIEVYGLTLEQIQHLLQHARFKVDAVGKTFGVLKIDNEIDVSVPRRENKIGVGHKGFNMEPDPFMSVEQAACRRDFTINSMAMTINGTIIDPFDGQSDLHNRVLRATSSAFMEDPLRVMRGMQFASRFAFRLDKKTIEMCAAMQNEFAALPRERIWEEWKKWALKGIRPSFGLELLMSVGWLQHFPEIASMHDVPQDPEWHPEGDVLTHVGHVVDAAAVIAKREQLDDHDRMVLMFAALTHDFGKVTTTRMEGGRWRSRGHCEVGVKPAERFLERVGAPLAIIAEVKPLISEHLVHAGIDNPSSKAVRRLANRIAPASIKALARVVEADHSGRPPLPKGNPFQIWVDKAEGLNVFSAKPEAILMGRHLIEMGVSPGRKMGVLLTRAFEAQLDGAFDNLEDAKQWARDHMGWLDVHMGS
jgi:tRNA nucleotidyltransferase (CCA-adding enzyme)